MAISSTAKLTEIKLRTTIPSFTSSYYHSPIPSFSLHRRPYYLFYSNPSLLKTFSSLRTTPPAPGNNNNNNDNNNNNSNTRNTYPWDDDDDDDDAPHKNPNNATKSKPSSDSWLNKWSTLPTPNANPPRISPRNSTRHEEEIRHFDDKREGGSARPNAVERIVLRLRNLGHGLDNESDGNEGEDSAAMPMITGEEKLGDLLRRDWVRPDKMLVEEVEEEDEAWLPWERQREGEEDEGEVKKNKRTVKPPTLAELTIEEAELRRLRRLGITLRERVSVPKAGITGAVLEKIHQQWRKSELVRLKFHESLVHDMRTAHEIVEVGWVLF